MLSLPGGLAEFERDPIRARTGEGRERAKASGQSLGRKPKLTSCRQRDPIQRRDRGEPLGQHRPQLNVSPSTISRLAA
jgi:DNA invertase Pin-like site-specific DNA recombinase